MARRVSTNDRTLRKQHRLDIKAKAERIRRLEDMQLREHLELL